MLAQMTKKKSRKIPKQKALNIVAEQAAAGKTVDIVYQRKRDEVVILRNVGVVEIDGKYCWSQDQGDGGRIKSLIINRIINVTPSKKSFDNEGFGNLGDK